MNKQHILFYCYIYTFDKQCVNLFKIVSSLLIQCSRTETCVGVGQGKHRGNPTEGCTKHAHT